MSYDVDAIRKRLRLNTASINTAKQLEKPMIKVSISCPNCHKNLIAEMPDGQVRVKIDHVHDDLINDLLNDLINDEPKEEEKEMLFPPGLNPLIGEDLMLWIIISAYDPHAPGHDTFAAILPNLKPSLFDDLFYGLVFQCFTEYTTKYGAAPPAAALRFVFADDNPQHIERFDKFICKQPTLSTLDWFDQYLTQAVETRTKIQTERDIQLAEYRSCYPDRTDIPDKIANWMPK